MDENKSWWNEVDPAQYLQIVIDEHTSSALTYDEFGAELALRAAPDQEMYLGGGDTLWDRVRAEVRLLICENSTKYKDLREKATKLSDQSAMSLVAVTSAGLGASLGVASTVIAPLVALLLLALVRVGKEVFCGDQYLDQKVTQ